MQMHRKMISLKLVLIIILNITVEVHGNWILSVTQSSQLVNQANQLVISIKSSTSIPTNSLKLQISQQFKINPLTSQCLVNNITVNCSVYTNTTSLVRVITFQTSFSTNNLFSIQINGILNPYYADGFALIAAVNNTNFITSGIITIISAQIQCKLSGSSKVVGQTTIGIFTIDNNPISIQNSQISVKTDVQTIYKNIFNSGPTCSYRNISLPCSLSTIFGQQILQIQQLPVMVTNSSLTISVSTVNNPPYNDTFGSLYLQIQDSLGRAMQHCTFIQEAPSTLQNIKSVSINNWASSLGSQSNISFYLAPYFTTLSSQRLILTYPSSLSIVPLSPCTYTSSVFTSMNKSYTSMVVSNSIATPNSILFYAVIDNPSFAQALDVKMFIVTADSNNRTVFREQYYFSNDQFLLKSETIPITYQLASNLTQATTTSNFTFQNLNYLDVALTKGIILNLSLSLGQFSCLPIKQSNLNNLSTINCNGSNIVLLSISSLVANKTYWLSFSVLNHYSTAQSVLSFDYYTSELYSISSNQLRYSLVPNTNMLLTITNLNTTLMGLTSIEIKQDSQYTELNYLNYRTNKVRRVFSMQPPNNLRFNSNTTIISLDSNCTIIKVSLISLNLITLIVEGYLSITIKNLNNPIDYVFGNRQWKVTVTDQLNNPSLNVSCFQSPQYTPSLIKLSSLSSNLTILEQQIVNITIQPQLEYVKTIALNQTPTVFLEFSDSQILGLINCSTCYLISSTKVGLTYFSVVMMISLRIRNSQQPSPFNQYINVQIRYGSFVYEHGQIKYALVPRQFSWISSFSGLYGQIGQLNITLSSPLSLKLSIISSGTQNILASPVCRSCNLTFQSFTGLVKYFQSSSIQFKGISIINNTQVVYQRSFVLVKYTCLQVQGCNVCQIINKNVICKRCFGQQFTELYLLYQNQCLANCPVQTYSTGIVCSKCKGSCYNCSQTQCYQCLPGYFVYLNTCVAQCPNGYTNNATHCLAIKIICPQNCLACPSDNICNQCTPPYKLLLNICYPFCPSGFISSSTDISKCTKFIPPQQSKYFPFAFLICSILIMVILIIIKCFEKRSLMMGNFIAVLSLFEFGSFVMTLAYTLVHGQINIFVQLLVYLLLLSKILINLFFILYFLKTIRPQQQFQNWLAKEQTNIYVYKVLLTLSIVISFQTMRLIYSRFMGLRMFFGKFTTGLIFKPINYFSLAYSILFVAPLIILCVTNINTQDGYKTSLFYTSLQTIIIQCVLLFSWILDWTRGKQDQFFDYQVYKIQNQFSSDSGPALGIIQIQSQNQIGGSNHNIFQSSSKLKFTKKQLRKDWVRSQIHSLNNSKDPILNQISNEIQQLQVSPKDQRNQINYNNSKKSIFRRKIIKQWRKLQQQLPRTNNIYNHLKKSKSKQIISKSPYTKSSNKIIDKKQTKIKKSYSVQKIQVQFPQVSTNLQHLKAGQRVKRYFHQIIKDTTNHYYINKEQQHISKENQHIINLHQHSKSNSITFCNQNLNQQNNINNENSQNLQNILQRFSQIPIFEIHNSQNTNLSRKVNKDLQKKDKIIIQRSLNINVSNRQNSFFHQQKQIDKQVSDLYFDGITKDQEQNITQNINQSTKQKIIENSNSQGEQFLDERDQTSANRLDSKRKRLKRRKLSKGDKSTQKVYLQRLANGPQQNSNKNVQKKKRYKQLSDF